MKEIIGGVTAVQGFTAAGIAAGLKKNGRNDMALVFSDVDAVAAGVFTTNAVKAAPVQRDIEIVKTRKTVRGVVLNAGNANACTGEEGKKADKAMAAAAAEALGVETDDILTCSTGVIGQLLPVGKVTAGAKLLAESLSSEGGDKAAQAIMTTDTYSKQCAVEVKIGGKTVTIGAMTKGSGMIHPNMATMLCVTASDVAMSKELLQEAVRDVVNVSFNMISVDRDTSTNDSYMILANGKAGNPEITEKNADYEAFKEALCYVAVKLAKLMAADGEGATKLLEVTVKNAASEESAKVLSKAVITSNLVKAAVFGSDANWGRIICALGYSGIEFNPEAVDLWVESESGKLKLAENGLATDYSEEFATKILSDKEVTVTADMKMGKYNATAWGCDLTYDYVKINGDYRS
ncbi:bifunctional glutamate N-acetyltransferase/amino-acid acetyltransferase ArgJ [[Clostridium] polysaccharolyticum]|uniref:Arginine biosynthesis bifunctional protein ArgJ n=1 Tax=[Clostridium] polysaccharolyticum TaxID=29364 RepID=A0A1I0EKB9_9FIRM|nr:bifunctional glutamate N-acetyltransferase/amino-acid acetyltransferase ArgJ [[Clostridium] polysaccharolyticum]SET45884.1 glutamate N-acetyltransferase [[Clostridium] polysaccharolyticum]